MKTFLMLSAIILYASMFVGIDGFAMPLVLSFGFATVLIGLVGVIKAIEGKDSVSESKPRIDGYWTDTGNH